VPVASVRYLADHISGAQYREFEGDDHFERQSAQLATQAPKRT
jgi:hypothetical protein